MAIALAIILLTMTWKRAILFVTEAITMTKIPACTISMQDTIIPSGGDLSRLHELAL